MTHGSPSPASGLTTFAIATTLGLVTAMAAHVALTRAGSGLGSAWQALFPEPHALVRAAMAWWGIAAAGFGAGYGAVRAAPLIARQPAAVLGPAALAGVALLAWTGHGASGALTRSAGASLGLHLLALILGALLAGCGAYAALLRERNPGA